MTSSLAVPASNASRTAASTASSPVIEHCRQHPHEPPVGVVAGAELAPQP